MTDRVRMITYDVPLRFTEPPHMAQLMLPADLTMREAERIAAFIRAVAFEETTALGKLARAVAQMPSPKPWGAQWETIVVNELKAAGVLPTGEILEQVWKLAMSSPLPTGGYKPAADIVRTWINTGHPALEAELADDPRRSE